MQTTIDLLRHGEVEGAACYRGSTDDLLTPNGWQQMRPILSLEPPWQRIISSPLQRCSRFAHELAEQHALTLEYDERLQEMHFGAWEGQSLSVLLETDKARLEQFWRDPLHSPPPQGESLQLLQTRVIVALNDLLERYRGEHLLLITHGGVIRILLAHVLVMPLHAVMRLEVPHAALSRIQIYSERDLPDAYTLAFHAGVL